MQGEEQQKKIWIDKQNRTKKTPKDDDIESLSNTLISHSFMP